MSPEAVLLGTLVLPLLGAIAVVLLGRWPNLRDGASLAVGVGLFALVARVAWLHRHGVALELELELGTLAPGLPFALGVEPLGLMFALLASLLWPITTLYAIGYMRGHGEKNQTRFYTFFALAISAVLGLAFARNLVTLFVFYEVITLSTWPLVTHTQSTQAYRAGRIYLGILMSSSVGLLLLGCIAVHALCGSTEFTPGGLLSAPHASGALDNASLGLLLALFVFGTAKAAVMPMHRWLPNAMVAPTPVSALLHAVAVVKAGVFTITKVVVYVFGLDLLSATGAHFWLAYVAGFTVVAASVVALRKDNLKERLAYSTIGQLSYVVLGALLAHPQAVVGSSMHIAMHAFGKITLFFGAGAILVAAHKTRVSELDGLGRKMPITFACFFVGTLAIIGLPPTGGMWSKLLLLEGTAATGHWLLLGALLVSSLLNVVYLFQIPLRAFLKASPEDRGEELPEPHAHGHHGPHAHGEAPLPCRIAMVATAIGSVALFLDPDLVHGLVAQLVNP